MNKQGHILLGLILLISGCATPQYDWSKPSLIENFVKIQDQWRDNQKKELDSFIGISKEDLVTSIYLSYSSQTKIDSNSVEYHQNCDQQTLNTPQISTISGWGEDGPIAGTIETEPAALYSHKNIERIIKFYFKENKVYSYYDSLQESGISAFCERIKM